MLKPLRNSNTVSAMKSFAKFLLLAISAMTMTADAGALLLSNSKGFDSNPIVANSGASLTGSDPVLVAVGTFSSEPASLLAGASTLIGTQRYAALMAEFTGFGNPVGLEASTPPLARRGTFSYQGTQTVAGTPLENKPVYVVIAKGGSLAAATEVAILKTGATFQAADDESALPKLVTVGTSAGSVVIVGSGSRFTAVPTALSSTARPAYSLAQIVPAPELVVEPPAGLVLPGGNGSADFGAVELGGSSAAAVFTIRNLGDANLTTLALQVNAPGDGEFLLDTTATAAAVAPGGATTFTLRFAPTVAGLRNANLTITSNDASRNPLVIPLSGVGLPPSQIVTVSVTPQAVSEDDQGNLTYTFARTGPATYPLTVNFSATGTADAATDFSVGGADAFASDGAGSVTFAAGSATAVVTVDPTSDPVLELDEMVQLTVLTGSGYQVGEPASAVGAILNDDAEVSVAVAPSSMAEDAPGTLDFTFSRVGPLAEALSVNFSVGGTAAFAADYTQNGATAFSATNGTVTFAIGSAAAVVAVDPVADSTLELHETVSLTVSPGSGYGVAGTATVTGTITNDDTLVPLQFPDASAVPLTLNGFTATGQSVGPMTLEFDPAPGQVLTLVSNTSANPIDGVFTNLADGGTIATSYGGRDFLFVANYAGGDGNDLTLTLLNPEIAVEQPLLTDVSNGGTKSFGTMVLGSPVSLLFTIKNTGPGILNGLTITKSGTDQAAYTVTAAPTAPVAGPTGTTTFTVQFNPATSGTKIAALHIASDDADENPFDITLTGQALSANDDTDTDGLNDASEFLMSALGYDWQVSQPALVSALMSNANSAGLYTPTQVQALHTGTPLISRDPGTGKFKLTMDWKKSTNLTDFLDFPAPPGSAVSINPQGDVEFEFPSTDDAAFFRIEVE
jgi:hypothetical protein